MWIRRYEDRVLLLLTLIIGAVVGLVVVAFILVTENLASHLYPAGGSPWRRLALPIVGALSTGYFLSRHFPNARGSGIPQTKAALFLRDGFISLRTVLGKFGLSSVSLASGIALGREGPSVQVGAGIASVLGRRLGLGPERVKALVPVGASAALAAAFNTPIAAVLFSLEEVMGDLHAPVLGSIVLSSATSWMVLHLLLGDEPLFHVPAYQLVHPLELLIYAVLGVVGGLVSVSFVKLLLWLRRHFLNMAKSTEWLQPAVGGLLVGLLAWFVPGVLGVGYGTVSLALNGQIALGMMALLVVLKVAATATCYASGNAGGIFGPALFMGAMTGGAIGGAAHLVLPDYTGSVGAYALVGMGAAFAGIIRVPLTSVIMIFEITRDYSIIVPLMIANLISYYLSSRLQKEPIYEALQHQDGVYLPSGARDRQEVALVSRGIRPVSTVLRADDTVAVAAAAAGGVRNTWVVVGESGLLGMITTEELERAVSVGRGQEKLADILGPGEAIGTESVRYPYVHVDHPLDTAMRRMADAGVEILPVVSRSNLRQVEGVISLPDVLNAYGFGKGRDMPEEPPREFSAPVGRLASVAAVIIGVLLIAVSLGYFYRSQRTGRATESFKKGNELMQDGRYPEAIEQYRNALSISHSEEHRLALGLALVKAKRMHEAEIYLGEVLSGHPTNAPANRGLAEAYVEAGRMDDAVTYYHRAIYGAWPDHAQEYRVQTRIELVEVLGRSGRTKQAQVELLSLTTDLPADAALDKRVARLLLGSGLAKESADVFREVIRRDKNDAEAYIGLGDAEVARWNYASARDAFRHALRINPSDPSLEQRLENCNQVLELDPTVAGLRSKQRFERSQKLLVLTVAAMDQCRSLHPDFSLPETIMDSAHKELSRRRSPASYADATDNNLSLTKQLWSSHPQACDAVGGTALSSVLAHLSR